MRFGVAMVNAAKLVGIVLLTVEAGEDDRLIALQPLRLVDGTRIETLELEIAFCTGDEKGRRLLDAVQPRKVQVAAIHDVDGARFEQEFVEDVHVVHAAGRDNNDSGNVAAHIQQGAQLHGTLAFSKRGPGKQRQTQVYGGRIQ